ncbi:hypothetical protein TcasGA2_TC015803 [Tribolium castaneum]|uniref:Uncharacterized protein n=1 Tax=Tribolium castaneum TaxID=7070 RepID=D2A415_TRICA|nr:hypothetical protein TcasGA2_TC015803 [Tribolium castaneum]
MPPMAFRFGVANKQLARHRSKVKLNCKDHPKPGFEARFFEGCWKKSNANVLQPLFVEVVCNKSFDIYDIRSGRKAIKMVVSENEKFDLVKRYGTVRKNAFFRSPLTVQCK